MPELGLHGFLKTITRSLPLEMLVKYAGSGPETSTGALVGLSQKKCEH